MIRNMPNNYNRKMLLNLLDTNGFCNQYDFVYLPIDFKTTACMGYAFAIACMGYDFKTNGSSDCIS